MKQINQLIHSTKSIVFLKSILQEGLYASYSKEVFNEENILIPMISFSNILFRDIGNGEVVSYGDYGIVISRDLGMDKYGLNPVMYLSKNSKIEQGFHYNFNATVIPQIIKDIKEFKTHNPCYDLKITPCSKEVENLIDNVDEKTSEKLLSAIENLFGNIFENTLRQVYLLKPYKVKDKNGKEWIAYNEREWRRNFFKTPFIREYKPNGTKNEKYIEIINTPKPHFSDQYHTLKIDIQDIQNIIVKEESEIIQIEDFIRDKLSYNVPKGIVSTFEILKEKERKII